MTPQEQQLLQGLTDRVNQTQLTGKDPDAEKFIFEHLGKNSDSLYILSQTVLVQQYALDNATKQIADLKQQLQQAQQQPAKHTSFLGSLLGNDAPSRPAPPPPPPQPQYSQAQYVPVPSYGPPQVVYAEPIGYGSGYGYGSPYGGMGGGMGQGGFLRGAMQTAAGVAAGALAFEGIESLMHGFGEHAGYGSGFEGMGGGRPEEIINNNYYGDSAGGHSQGDLTDRFAAAGDQPSPDVEDRRFAGNDVPADDTTQPDDSNDSTDNFVDDSNTDDSGADPSDNFDSGTDDSGGGFDNGGSDDSGF
jgi:hypothetical protein